MRLVFLAVDTQWVDPAGDYASFSYAARKLEASVRSAPDLGHVETQVIDLKSDDPDVFFEAIRGARPDIVAGSTYIWSVATFLEVARMIKAWDPSIRVVLGGPAARTSLLGLPRFKHLLRYVDAIATGEGEEIVRAIARTPAGEGFAHIPGLLLPHPLGLRATAVAERPELDAYASPYHLGLAPRGRTGFIETFRGCPISCAFCQWGDQRSDRVYGTEYLAKHLQGLVDAEATNVFFTDAAFNLSARAFRNLLEADRQVGALARFAVHGHLYPTHVKEEHLEFLARVGKAQVSIGVQTFDAEVLRKLGRPFDLVRFEGVLRELRGRIPIDVELIYGLPGDNPDSFRRTLEKTIELADTVRLFQPLVLPDALLERVDEFGIRFDPDTFAILECDGWSAAAMADGWEEIVRATESFPNFMAASTWLGFATNTAGSGNDAGAARGMPLPTAQAASLGTSLEQGRAGWSLGSARQDNDRLLLELVSPRGSVVLEVAPLQPEGRSFARRGDVGYSYRGTIDRADAAELAEVIDAIHPGMSALLGTMATST